MQCEQGSQIFALVREYVLQQILKSKTVLQLQHQSRVRDFIFAMATFPTIRFRCD